MNALKKKGLIFLCHLILLPQLKQPQFLDSLYVTEFFISFLPWFLLFEPGPGFHSFLLESM